uniref:Uncharacterized protein n=1 Tax=Romanomermis culicivorax TaxID=13658 RepID=A0A915JJM4_ROMCU
MNNHYVQIEMIVHLLWENKAHYSFSKINALNFELGNIENKRIPSHFLSLFILYDTNATYVKNPCVIIDRFLSVKNSNFSHSRKLIEEYVVKLRQSHNKKPIFYMLPDDKHSVYEFDLTWGFSKWLGCAFETKIRTVQLYVSIQERSPPSGYDAYHGHPFLAAEQRWEIWLAGNKQSEYRRLINYFTKTLNIYRKNKSEQFLQKIEKWNVHLAFGQKTYLRNNLAWMDCIRQSLKDKHHKYETYVPDFGQLRGSDLQFLFARQNLDDWHYEPGVSIRTAAYDFRKLPPYSYTKLCMKHVCWYGSELENRTLAKEEQLIKELPSTVVGLPYMSSRAVFNNLTVDSYMNYTQLEHAADKWDTARTIIENLSCHENGLKAFSHPGVEFHCIFGYGFKTEQLDNTTVDGDGYVPRRSAEYCQILQQGADGDRVHVKAIKEFHHFVPSTYGNDLGTAELMKIRLARPWSHRHRGYNNWVKDNWADDNWLNATIGLLTVEESTLACPGVVIQAGRFIVQFFVNHEDNFISEAIVH